jgi:hypothetical protein
VRQTISLLPYAGSPSGCYVTSKNCHEMSVRVLLLQVNQVDETWPECAVRERIWVSAVQASSMPDEPALSSPLEAALERLSDG